jgi:glucokinase
MTKSRRDRLTSGIIARALEKGDPMAVRLIDDAVWAMGLALASAQNVLDLEAITLGGGLGDRLGQPFADRVAASMLPHLFRPEEPPKLLASTLGDLAGAIGAALRATGHSLVPAGQKSP